MYTFLVTSAARGWKLIKDNPQIFYTFLMALLIVAAFIFMSQRFLTIVIETRAQFERQRLSWMHDAFVEVVPPNIGNPAYLTSVMKRISEVNETIRSFRVSRKVGEESIIIASLRQDEVGLPDPDEEIYRFISIDADSTYVIETEEGGGRVLKGGRLIEGSLWVFTEITLSQFDAILGKKIEEAYYLLTAVVFVILFLLLRHARILDYASLYRRLQEIGQLKDDFISMASHELRSPLAQIRGYIDLVTGKSGATEDVKKGLREIDRAAKDLDALVADLLDVSRIEQGRMQFTPTEFDLTSFVQEVSGPFDESAKKKGLSFTFQGSTVSRVFLDKDRLRQVLVNVIANAIKYTFRGNVKVEVYQEGGRAVVRVSDTGIGISAEDQKLLFQKFYRVKSSETKNIVGTGLGLWITVQLIRLMKGTISVESIKGVGSHFIMTFPLFAVEKK